MEPTIERDLLLPEGTRLVHIGPHKTGTTSIQASLFAARPELLAQGVRHAGRNRNPISAVMAGTGQAYQGAGVPSIQRWRRLVREIVDAPDRRVVISSEFFADAKPEAIRRVVTDLDPERVHIVVTLRPLPRILASQWQQWVQGSLRSSYDEWLDAVFHGSGATPRKFWYRHRHDELIARWAEVVGLDRVTAVVVDDRDHELVLRVFEQLLGLRPGTLKPVEVLTNRSLTMPEVEVIRAFNILFKRYDLDTPLYTQIMRFGAAAWLKQQPPDPGAARVETPQWALDRAGEIAREVVANVAACGVQVVGDLDILTQVPVSGIEGDRQPDVTIPPNVAASVAMGVLVAAGLARDHLEHGKDEDGQPVAIATRSTGSGRNLGAEPVALFRVPTSMLAVTIVRRVVGLVTRKLSRFRSPH